MSIKTEKIRHEIADLKRRLAIAEQDHERAKDRFGGLQAPAGSALWCKMRDEIDTTLTRKRIIESLILRLSADLIDQQIIDKE